LKISSRPCPKDRCHDEPDTALSAELSLAANQPRG
jgi:hypothetical protein